MQRDKHGYYIPTKEQIEKYGQPKKRIAGSMFFRAYCEGCGDPIRLEYEGTGWCNLCSGLGPRWNKPATLDEDAGSYRTIAVRALEDG